jgi:hypothetical protein
MIALAEGNGKGKGKGKGKKTKNKRQLEIYDELSRSGTLLEVRVHGKGE